MCVITSPVWRDTRVRSKSWSNTEAQSSDLPLMTRGGGLQTRRLCCQTEYGVRSHDTKLNYEWLTGRPGDIIIILSGYWQSTDRRRVMWDRSPPEQTVAAVASECPGRAVQCPQCGADSGYNIRQAADKLSRVQVLAEITRHHTGSVLCHRSQSEKLWISWENCCSSLVLSCCQWNAAGIRINDLCLEREQGLNCPSIEWRYDNM